jgi:thiamine biosynthesis lipoprotein
MTTSLLPGQVRTRTEHVWGTVVSIDVRDEDTTDAAVDAAWESVRTELHRIDAVFSTFREDSVVSRLRLGGAQVIADDVADVIDLCLEARMATGGAFDPWCTPGGFDPSGLVKGWAADRSAEILRRHGLTSFSVDAAGDVVCRGRIHGRPWPIGIAHPDDPRSVVAVVEVLDAAIATSGTSQRGDHVLDPRTGGAATGARQATVVGPDAALADAYATALVVSGVSGAAWFSALPGWSAHVVEGSTATAWGPAFTTEDTVDRPHADNRQLAGEGRTS